MNKITNIIKENIIDICCGYDNSFWAITKNNIYIYLK